MVDIRTPQPQPMLGGAQTPGGVPTQEPSFEEKASKFRQAALAQGFTERQISGEINKQRARFQTREQLPGAVEAGLVTQEQALEAAGGLTTPGAVELVSGLKFPEEGVPKELKAKRQVALDAVNQLEKLFGRGSAENVGTGKDLSLAGKGKFGSRTGAKIKAGTSSLFDPELKEDVNIFQAAVENSVGILTQAFGSGTPQEAEAARLIEAAPNPTSTDAEAKAWFTNVRSLLGKKEPDVAKEALDQELIKKKELGRPDIAAMGVPPTTEPALEAIGAEVGAPPEEPERTLVQKIAGKVAGAAPVVGGVVGGITGGVLGGGVASLFTGALGTTIGTGAGIAFGETLQDLVGIQDETPEEQIKKGIVTPATAGAMDLAGGALFMGGGAVVKQLGKGIFKIGDDIAVKAIRPSPSQQRKFLKKTGQEIKDFVVEKGLFKKGVEQVDNLISPLQNSFDDIALKSGQQIPTDSIVTKFSSKVDELLAIPTKEAQTLAKQLQDDASLFINKFGDQDFVDVADITNLRRTIDDLLPKTKFLQDPIRAGKNRMIRNIYQESVQEGTEGLVDASGRNLKQIGQELNKLYEFRGIAEQQAGLGKGTLPVGLIKAITVSGGAGAGFATGRDLETTLTGALVGFGLPAVANNPRVVSFLARNLTTVGKGLQAVPEKQKAKVLTDVFRRLLTNIGAVGISQVGAD